MHNTARRSLKRLLVDRCEILDRPRTKGTLNRSTLAVTTTEDELWSGPCLVAPGVSSRGDDQSGEAAQVDEFEVRLPADAPDFQNGSIVRVVKSQDDALIGAELEVFRSSAASRVSFRTLDCRRARAFGSRAVDA